MTHPNYVRCRHCDTAWHLDQVKFIEMPNTVETTHSKGAFICGACGYTSKSYVFWVSYSDSDACDEDEPDDETQEDIQTC